jgi:hypothetical protein
LLREKTHALRVAAAFVAVFVLAGCNGGTVDRHALTNDAGTIDSINCEAWLVSDGAARDRVTTAYTRVQSKALALQASNLADALAHRPTAAGLERRTRAKARAAATLAARLRALHAHPTDRPAARTLSERFKRAGGCA